MPHVVHAMGAVEIGGGPAILGEGDVGVLHEIVLLINDRALAPDEDDGLPVVQEPHFIRGHQLFATMSSDEFKIGKKMTLLV